MSPESRRVLITGGFGYVGSVLVPKVLARSPVTVVDALYFGNHLPPADGLTVVPADIRDTDALLPLLRGCTDVIHLAAIANDPSADLDTALTREINHDAVARLIAAAKAAGVRRFLNASSSSVYGVKEEAQVTEDLPLEPLTPYARYKGEAEIMLRAACDADFVGVSVRAATVCGHSPRMRFDVIVNLMVRLAELHGRLTVHGGGQQRPNIHIQDLTDCYMMLLDAPAAIINGQVYNVGAQNHTVLEIAQMVRDIVGGVIEVQADVVDQRSYRISSERIRRDLGFAPHYAIRDAIHEVHTAFVTGAYPEPDAPRYFNVRTMQALNLKPIGAPR